MKTTMAILMLAGAALAGDGREDVARKLETKLSVNLRGARLADAIELLRGETGIQFVLADGAETAVSLTVRDVTAKSALRLLLAPADLVAAFEDGVVVIRSRQRLAGAVVYRVYDVRGVLVKLEDFPGPGIELKGLPRVGVLGFG